MGALDDVAVIGLGLIGGSLALAVGARGFDSDPAARDGARGRGIAVADSLAAAVRGARLVVAAVPAAEAPAVLRAAAGRGGAVLTDVASVKGPLLAALGDLPKGTRVVGGHPMAGSTARGIAAADAALFRDRPWLLVPTERSDAAAMALVGELARAAGARPLVLSAQRHDQLMTWVSHLPLAVASALARSARRHAGEGVGEAAGPGFVDTTRLAATPRDLALELALADPAALARALDALRDALGELAEVLRSDAREALGAFLDEAAAARAELEAAPTPTTKPEDIRSSS